MSSKSTYVEHQDTKEYVRDEESQPSWQFSLQFIMYDEMPVTNKRSEYQQFPTPLIRTKDVNESFTNSLKSTKF